MDWKTRETSHYNLRSLKRSTLLSKTRDTRSLTEASNSTSHPQSSHQESRNRSLQQSRWGRPRKMESSGIDYGRVNGHYNLRSLTGSTLNPRKRGPRYPTDANNSSSRPQSSHQDTRNTNQQQNSRNGPQMEESSGIDRSVRDRRAIAHRYNLRPLTSSALQTGTRDQRNNMDANIFNSYPQSSHRGSFSTRCGPLKKKNNRIDRSRSDHGSDGSEHSRDRHDQQRKINSTLLAHLSGVPNSTSDKSDDVSDDIKCVICIDTIDDTEMKYVKCGHSFHKNCCDNWLKVNNNCPICRTVVVAPRRMCEVIIEDATNNSRISFTVNVSYEDLAFFGVL